MIAEDKLIFLSCLPRSGSTLLQRIFAECDLVFTESESWLMLPLLDLRLDFTIETVYSKNSALQAIDGFYNGIQPDKIDGLYRDFALGLYAEKMPQNAEFFLDKTPRYYLISDNLEKVFPNAKHIYLTRNPIAVLVSIYTSWVSNDLNALVNYQVDLVEGVRRLAKTVNSTRGLVCSYENLLELPQKVFSNIAAYTGLVDMSSGSLTYRRPAAGLFGDDQALIKSGELDVANRNKWHDQLKDPILFELASAYLDSLDAEIFEDLGYVRDETKAILEEARLKHSHLPDPSQVKISGFSLPQFFSGKWSPTSSHTWYALRKNNDAQKEKLRDYQSVLKKFSDLSVREQALRKEHKKEKRKFSDLSAREQALREKHVAQKQELRNYQSTLKKFSELSAREQALRKEHKAVKRKLSNLSAREQALREKHGAQKQELRDYQSTLKKFSDLSAREQALRKEHKAEKRKLSNLSAREQALREKHGGQKQELRDCQRALSIAASTNLSLTGVLDKLEFEVSVAKETIGNQNSAIKIYQGLANSSWVKLGNALNEPLKATRRLLTKFK